MQIKNALIEQFPVIMQNIMKNNRRTRYNVELPVNQQEDKNSSDNGNKSKKNHHKKPLGTGNISIQKSGINTIYSMPTSRICKIMKNHIRTYLKQRDNTNSTHSTHSPHESHEYDESTLHQNTIPTTTTTATAIGNDTPIAIVDDYEISKFSIRSGVNDDAFRIQTPTPNANANANATQTNANNNLSSGNTSPLDSVLGGDSIIINTNINNMDAPMRALAEAVQRQQQKQAVASRSGSVTPNGNEKVVSLSQIKFDHDKGPGGASPHGQRLSLQQIQHGIMNSSSSMQSAIGGLSGLSGMNGIGINSSIHSLNDINENGFQSMGSLHSMSSDALFGISSINCSIRSMSSIRYINKQDIDIISMKLGDCIIDAFVDLYKKYIRDGCKYMINIKSSARRVLYQMMDEKYYHYWITNYNNNNSKENETQTDDDKNTNNNNNNGNNTSNNGKEKNDSDKKTEKKVSDNNSNSNNKGISMMKSNSNNRILGSNLIAKLSDKVSGSNLLKQKTKAKDKANNKDSYKQDVMEQNRKNKESTRRDEDLAKIGSKTAEQKKRAKTADIDVDCAEFVDLENDEEENVNVNDEKFAENLNNDGDNNNSNSNNSNSEDEKDEDELDIPEPLPKLDQLDILTSNKMKVLDRIKLESPIVNWRLNRSANHVESRMSIVKAEFRKHAESGNCDENVLLEWLLTELIETMETAVREVSFLMNDSFVRFMNDKQLHEKVVNAAKDFRNMPHSVLE